MTPDLRLLLLGAGLGLAVGAAQAGDWEGPYAGAFAGWISSGGGVAGAQAGYAFEIGDGVYAGPEVDGFYIADMGEAAGSAALRIGVQLSEDILVYGRAGGFALTNGDTGWLIGGGAAAAVDDSVSVFAGADRYDCGCIYTVVRGGVQLKF